MLFHVWHILQPFHRGLYLAQKNLLYLEVKTCLLICFWLWSRASKHHKRFDTRGGRVHLVSINYCVWLLAFPESPFWSFPRECLISLAWHLPYQCISASFSNNMDHMFSVESRWRHVERPGLSLIGLNNELVWLKAFNALLSLKMRNRLRISPLLKRTACWGHCNMPSSFFFFFF